MNKALWSQAPIFKYYAADPFIIKRMSASHNLNEHLDFHHGRLTPCKWSADIQMALSHETQRCVPGGALWSATAQGSRAKQHGCRVSGQEVGLGSRSSGTCLYPGALANPVLSNHPSPVICYLSDPGQVAVPGSWFPQPSKGITNLPQRVRMGNKVECLTLVSIISILWKVHWNHCVKSSVCINKNP